MTPELLVRPSGKADLARIDALLARSYPILLRDAYPPSVLVTALPLISKAQPRLVDSGTYFVVADGDDIVGAGGWTRAAPGTQVGNRATTGHIRHVVTDYRRVREGIGQLLMTHVIQSAKASGISRMECLSTIMAVPFYASCGFAEHGPITVPLRPGIDFPAVAMSRAL